jgi:hypothetical protein
MLSAILILAASLLSGPKKHPAACVGPMRGGRALVPPAHAWAEVVPTPAYHLSAVPSKPLTAGLTIIPQTNTPSAPTPAAPSETEGTVLPSTNTPCGPTPAPSA